MSDSCHNDSNNIAIVFTRLRHVKNIAGADTAYACDPRIVKFKEEEKQKKLAVKQAKQDAIAKVKAEENERVGDVCSTILRTISTI